MADFDKIKLLTMELSVFFIIQFFGLFIAKRLLERNYISELPTVSAFSFAIGFVIATAFILLAAKFLKSGVGFKLLFVMLIVIGSQTFFNAFFPKYLSYALAMTVLLLWLAFPFVLVHDFIILFAVGGISAQLGLSMDVMHVLILFAALSIYDVIAVYKTKHMIKMFKKLVHHGVYLAIIIPFKLKDFFKNTKKAKPGKDFLMLGTGDLAFPLILATACLKVSLLSSIFVILGAAVGVTVIFYMLVSQTDRKAMPALPPIALGSFIGYLLSILVHMFL